jgi:hemerythrin superfamily protein
MRVGTIRLTDFVAAARPAHADRLTGIASWFARYEQAIDDHHSSEEAVVYPALLQRDPSFAAADAELEGQHEVLADRLAVARESPQGLAAASDRPSWERERDDAVAATREPREIITAHLDHEEDVVFSRYQRYFTAAEFAALSDTARTLVGARAVVFTGPLVLDHATQAERTQLLADQPLLLRVLYRLVLRPRYERQPSSPEPNPWSWPATFR